LYISLLLLNYSRLFIFSFNEYADDADFIIKRKFVLVNASPKQKYLLCSL